MIYIPEVMVIKNEDNPEWEVFINDQNNVFIGLERERAMHSPYFILTKEEWKVLKTFIDNQFKKDGNA